MGGMGTVYRALDTEIGRHVAVKLLAQQPGTPTTFIERFRQEFQVIGRLEHPHIVPVYDVGQHEGRPFLVMRLLVGGDLRRWARQADFTPVVLLPALAQLADALDTAHHQQVIHRDVKPGNILFDERGAAFLSDFGIAKVLNANAQLTGSAVLGTPAYMSPEQFTGRGVDGRSDQYALAVVVYELLAGRLPFAGDTAQMMYQHLEATPPPLREANLALPAGVDRVMGQALAKNPAGRFDSVAAFVVALQQAMNEATLPVSKLAVVPAVAPAGAAESYRRGLAALNETNWPAAVAAFEQVLTLDPHYRNARTLHDQARQKQARAASRAAKQTIPRPTQAAVAAPVEKARPLPPSHAAAPAPVTTPAVPAPASPLWRSPAVLAVGGLMVLVVLLLLAYSALAGRDEESGEPAATASAAVVLLPSDTAASEPTPRPTPAPGSAAISVAGPGAMAKQPGGAFEPVSAGAQIPVGQGVAVQSGQGNMELILSNGDQLFLAADTELELNQLAGFPAGQPETRLGLHHGMVLAVTPAGEEGRFIIENPFGATVELAGTIMGVAYDTARTMLEVDCFAGPCRLRDIGGELEIGSGRYARVGGSGVPGAEGTARYELYCPLATYTPCPTATPNGQLSSTTSPTWTAEPTRATSTPRPQPSFTPSLTPDPGDTAVPNPTSPPPGATETPDPLTSTPPPIHPTETPHPPTHTPTIMVSITAPPPPTATATPETPTSTAPPPPTATPTDPPPPTTTDTPPPPPTATGTPLPPPTPVPTHIPSP
jgi:hypothetical protein